jgi:hypothetical protein
MRVLSLLAILLAVAPPHLRAGNEPVSASVPLVIHESQVSLIHRHALVVAVHIQKCRTWQLNLGIIAFTWRSDPEPNQEREVLMMIDTGSTRTTFDIALKEWLGDQIGQITFNGVHTAPTYEFPKCRIGSMELGSDATVDALDLGQARKACGQEIYGILGMDVLSQTILQVDPDAGAVRFLAKVPPGSGRSIPMIIPHHLKLPTVKGNVGGLGERDFVIDTGCGSVGACTSEDFESLRKSDQLHVVGQRWVQKITGPTKREFGRFSAIEVGGFRHTGLVFAADDPMPNLGILGLEYFARYVTTFDFSQQKVYLRPASHFHDRVIWNVDYESPSGEEIETDSEEALRTAPQVTTQTYCCRPCCRQRTTRKCRCSPRCRRWR